MLRRRLLTIPGYFIATALWLGLLPVTLVAAAITDAVRRRGAVLLRGLAAITAYLLCESMGLLAAAALWLRRAVLPMSDEAWVDIHFRLEALWGSTLFTALKHCFSLEFEVHGADTAEIARGPYVLALRHCSTADTLLASKLISWPHGMRLRYVLKRELLWDPCLDVVGHRVPNVFVDRFTDDTIGEVNRVQGLTRNLGEHDGVLIYPEGTRFTEKKRNRVLASLRERGDAAMLEYAESLSVLLPPRPGGLLGLLDAAPTADVVLCTHTGFEDAETLGAIWRGGLIGRKVHVRFDRIARPDIPKEPDGAKQWLRDEWRRMNGWIEANRTHDTA